MNEPNQKDIKKVIAILEENSQFITSISGMGYNCVTDSGWHKVANEIAEYIEKEIDQVFSELEKENNKAQ